MQDILRRTSIETILIKRKKVYTVAKKHPTYFEDNRYPAYALNQQQQML